MKDSKNASIKVFLAERKGNSRGVWKNIEKVEGLGRGGTTGESHVIHTIGAISSIRIIDWLFDE
ncbi:hypothetical protein J31TS6_04480 [Brevibacillus reuszeri]|nr:hypothetical protein J31TS6_04480 [Brevibacillus reuszeri]